MHVFVCAFVRARCVCMRACPSVCGFSRLTTFVYSWPLYHHECYYPIGFPEWPEFSKEGTLAIVRSHTERLHANWPHLKQNVGLFGKCSGRVSIRGAAPPRTAPQGVCEEGNQRGERERKVVSS